MASLIQINQGEDSNVQGGLRLERVPGQSFQAGTIGPNNVGTNCFTDTVTVSGWTGTADLQTISVCVSNSTEQIEMRVFDGAPQVGDSILVTAPKYMGSAFASPPTTGNTELMFDFSSASITLTAGNDYYFIMTKATSNNTLNWYYAVNGSKYTNGQRIFINGGSSPATTIASLTSTQNEDLAFRLSMSLEGAGGGGDPIIAPITGPKYILPINEKMYCLLDTKDPEDRLVINAKTQIWKSGKSYFRYIFVHYNGEQFIMRLPNLYIVKPGTFEETLTHTLPLDPVNRHNTDNIVEIKRSSKMRRFQLNTKNCGVYFLVFYKNKNRFMIFGDLNKLNNGNATGCLIHIDNSTNINKLDHVETL